MREPELLRVPEVAERLRCTPEVVRRKIRSGEPPGLTGWRWRHWLAGESKK